MAARLCVLLAGVIGIAAFFLPLVTIEHRGQVVPISAFEVLQGLHEQEPEVGWTSRPAFMTDEDVARERQELGDALTEMKGIVLGCFAPAVLLAVIGGIALIRRKLGRLGGTVAVALGGLQLLIWFGLSAGADEAGPGADKGIALYLLLATGLFGLTGGMLAMVKPDHATA